MIDCKARVFSSVSAKFLLSIANLSTTPSLHRTAAHDMWGVHATLAFACLVLTAAHPSNLECATDATTRLVPGRDLVMDGDVSRVLWRGYFVCVSASQTTLSFPAASITTEGNAATFKSAHRLHGQADQAGWQYVSLHCLAFGLPLRGTCDGWGAYNPAQGRRGLGHAGQHCQLHRTDVSTIASTSVSRALPLSTAFSTMMRHRVLKNREIRLLLA